MTANQIISAKLLSLVANGMTMREAIDAVLGAGTFERVAGDVYDALNTKREG